MYQLSKKYDRKEWDFVYFFPFLFYKKLLNKFFNVLKYKEEKIRGNPILWSVIIDVYNWFIALMLSFRATDVLDIVAVSFIIYNVIKIARETRAEQLLKGILILLVAFTISQIFSLKMLNALFTSFFQFSMLAVLIVFQPELRSALEHIGRSKIARYWKVFLREMMKMKTISKISKEPSTVLSKRQITFRNPKQVL